MKNQSMLKTPDDISKTAVALKQLPQWAGLAFVYWQLGADAAFLIGTFMLVVICLNILREELSCSRGA